MTAPPKASSPSNGLTVWTLGLQGRKDQELVDAFSASGAEGVLDVRFNPFYPVKRNPRKLAALVGAAGLSYEWRKGLGNKLHRIGGYELADPKELSRLEAEIRSGRRFIFVCQCKCVKHCTKIEAPGEGRSLVCHPTICAKQCNCRVKCHRYVLITEPLLNRIPGLQVIDL